VPRTLEEIAEHARVDKKEIGRSYRFIVKELNIRINPTNPIDYIPRFASELGLSSNVQQRAIEILEQAINLGLTSGRGPMGVAAAALYIASIEKGERRTQRDVSEVAKVTEVTVRNRYKELQEKLGISVDV
jgi:transcription initiation factor TFIIB